VLDILYRSRVVIWRWWLWCAAGQHTLEAIEMST
jgi:hypothetical protein